MAMDLWFLYAGAALGLSLTPGPNSLLALTHGALYGARLTVRTVLGGVAGFTIMMALAMFGVGALLQTSAHALLVMKWLGGIYLIWLGVQLWRSPAMQLTAIGPSSVPRGRALFQQGLLSAMANPKVLLFYGAFLPQFIDPQRALLPQFMVMAATFAVAEFLVEMFLARLAHRIRPWLEKRGRRFNQGCGAVFVALGAALPMTR